MSRFFALQSLTAYTPGEQPRDRRYLKLNTNESPFPPPAAVIDAATEAAGSLQLYSDPDCRDLRAAAAGLYGVAPAALMPARRLCNAPVSSRRVAMTVMTSRPFSESKMQSLYL